MEVAGSSERYQTVRRQISSYNLSISNLAVCILLMCAHTNRYTEAVSSAERTDLLSFQTPKCVLCAYS
jgi:hypothetical protein